MLSETYFVGLFYRGRLSGSFLVFTRIVSDAGGIRSKIPTKHPISEIE